MATMCSEGSKSKTSRSGVLAMGTTHLDLPLLALFTPSADLPMRPSGAKWIRALGRGRGRSRYCALIAGCRTCRGVPAATMGNEAVPSTRASCSFLPGAGAGDGEVHVSLPSVCSLSKKEMQRAAYEVVRVVGQLTQTHTDLVLEFWDAGGGAGMGLAVCAAVRAA